MRQLTLPIKILLCVVVIMTTGFLSGMSTTGSIQEWYSTLNKPFFSPPNWIFAPVWTVLYILMGISVALIWHDGWKSKAVKVAIGIFILQFILNLFWSPVFFNLRVPTYALILIVILWALILLTIMKFNQINKTAGRLLIPYWLWVSFASILNASIVYLN